MILWLENTVSNELTYQLNCFFGVKIANDVICWWPWQPREVRSYLYLSTWTLRSISVKRLIREQILRRLTVEIQIQDWGWLQVTRPFLYTLNNSSAANEVVAAVWTRVCPQTDKAGRPVGCVACSGRAGVWLGVSAAALLSRRRAGPWLHRMRDTANSDCGHCPENTWSYVSMWHWQYSCLQGYFKKDEVCFLLQTKRCYRIWDAIHTGAMRIEIRIPKQTVSTGLRQEKNGNEKFSSSILTDPIPLHTSNVSIISDF